MTHKTGNNVFPISGRNIVIIIKKYNDAANVLPPIVWKVGILPNFILPMIIFRKNNPSKI